ncbi:hypothetical protein AAFC00_000800 [Neodothiora populina]|uniref:OTU domain-containing protein n=1 Tax=Neodothiora populina TaxID=2781224 RepID=A0ABR3PLV6_9PEZI
MEEIQATHRKQLKELQNKITQKKKQATKKTRKGVNDECDKLELELKERQAAELLALTNPGSTATDDTNGDEEPDLEESNGPDDDNDDDAALCHQAEKQLDITSIPTSTSSQSEPQPKKPNRARARLARRQAEQEALFAAAEREATNLPDLKQQERSRMLSEFARRNLREKEIRADGHCLYSAVADQLSELGIPLTTAPASSGRGMSVPFLARKGDAGAEGIVLPYRQVRKAAAAYISSHPDDFSAFLEEPLPGYVDKVANTGEWGGQLELLALAKTYGVDISVLQGDGRVEDIIGSSESSGAGAGKNGDAAAAAEKEGDKRIWLAYYRHGFGLGEHYNSLHKAAASSSS